jgi:arylsulfatase A-like enzyme
LNVELDDRARARTSWWTVLVFGAASGLLGESIELLHIQAGGIAPPGLALRAALLVTYGLIGAALLIAAGLVSRRRALPLAAVGFVLVALLPWLNFSLLPRFGSLRSLLGNVTVVALATLAVPLLVRFRRSMVAAVVGLGLAVNVWPVLQADAGPSVRRGGQPAALPFNVVLVLIDTLRADHLGAYGYARPTSPTFDALARDSVLFEGTTAQAAWTKPSVASLMTGVYVHRHGVVSNRDALGEAQPSLAEEMRARGYQTAAFSANPWITPEFRFDRGFDEFESGRAMGAQLTSLYKLLRRVDRALGARGVPANLSGWAFWGSSGNLGNAERDRLLTDSAVTWIESRGTDPYFLYVHLIGAHDPYDPPAEYARRFREPEWDGTVDRTIPPPRVQTVFDTADPLAEPERAALIAQYDGAIAYADAQLGRLVDALRRAGTLDRTLIVVTADHGEEFYEHRNWRHGNQLYNEIVHVPLLFRLPGRLPAGRRTDLSMLVDVLPTIVGLVEGTPARKGLDGLALFTQTDGRPPRAIFAEHWWFEGGTYVSRMVRQGPLKLQESRDEAGGQERSELYDLAGDPSEQRNLLENPSAVSENGVGELQGLLARFGDKVSVASAVAVDVDQSTRERLRQLGY